MATWLILGLQQGKYKMSLKHLPHQKVRKCSINRRTGGRHVKWAPETPERALNGQGWDNLINKIHNVVLDYNWYKWWVRTDINDEINKYEGEGTNLPYRRFPNNICRYLPPPGVELNRSPPWVWARLSDSLPKEKNSSFAVEKAGKFYLKQVIKFNTIRDAMWVSGSLDIMMTRALHLSGILSKNNPI